MIVRILIEEARHLIPPPPEDRLPLPVPTSDEAHRLVREGKLAEAEQAWRELLKRNRMLFGEENPDVIESLWHLADVLTWRRQWVEAESLYREVMAKLKKQHGLVHESVADCLDDLAMLFATQGNLTEAEKLLRQALSILKELLGEDHSREAPGSQGT